MRNSTVVAYYAKCYPWLKKRSCIAQRRRPTFTAIASSLTDVGNRRPRSIWMFPASIVTNLQVGVQMNIYVGNLSYETTEADVEEMFKEHGTVTQVNVITDKYTGRSKGFGFVEMEVQAEAEEAIKKLNGSVVGGRDIKVNQARPKNERSTSRSRNW